MISMVAVLLLWGKCGFDPMRATTRVHWQKFHLIFVPFGHYSFQGYDPRPRVIWHVTFASKLNRRAGVPCRAFVCNAIWQALRASRFRSARVPQTESDAAVFAGPRKRHRTKRRVATSPSAPCGPRHHHPPQATVTKWVGRKQRLSDVSRARSRISCRVDCADIRHGPAPSSPDLAGRPMLRPVLHGSSAKWVAGPC